MNLLGLGISAFICRFAYSGYAAIASPNLLRLMFAFASIALGFTFLTGGLFAGEYSRTIMTLGLALQTIGYFFIAFSHSLKSFDFAPHRIFALASLSMMPFVIPGDSIEHIVRSISFILLVYAAIETLASYMQNRKTSTLMIGSGLGLLALAELMAWYGFIFPRSSYYYAAIVIKIAGFGLLFVPFSKFGLTSGIGGRLNQIGSGI